ncbi:hypothetical protein [Buttiauxella sp. A111]|uniref:hypothetical protein n=1 Tax=Buttiauxella sp. A111 TaxID=2563088 RepID=UPI0010E1A52B|nr:hypothetical protein [Buttiauxella sp. A111]GDX05751.1 hypothetical protein BSPA111_19520 [Buttiauxella sp. A111]
MLNDAERERIKDLENTIHQLREELNIQRIVITGLIARLYTPEGDQIEKFTVGLRNAVTKKCYSTTKQQDYFHKIQKLIDASQA